MKSKNNNRRRLASPRKMEFQPLESRVVLAASLGWDGPGLGSAELTYCIANSPSSLSQAQTTQAIETALKVWSSVADIKFTRTNQPGLNDSIDFSFASIDGPSKTLAQAYFPDDVNPARIAGDVQFDSSENWEVGNSRGNSAFDLVLTAVHEIGHSLGLDHSDAANSVLEASITTQSEFKGLSEADEAAILELYRSVDGASSGSDNAESGSTEEGSTSVETGDDESSPFPREHWRHGGQWQRFGSRLDIGTSYIHNIYSPNDVNADDRTSALDALAIINALSNQRSSSLDLDSSALCDANNDGKVSALDALMVIGALSKSRSAAPVIVTSTVSQQASALAVEPTASEPIAGTSEAGSAVDDSAVVDKPTAVSFFANKPILAKFSADKLIERFDADASGGLTEAELPSKVWQALVAVSADTNSDAIISTTELQTAITAARQEKFDSKDLDSNGLLTSTEVGTRAWSKLASADTDSSGDVSFEEYNTWLTIRTESRAADGHPGRGRGHGHRHGPAELWKANADAFFERFDADGDSILTATELPTKILEVWVSKQVDSNRDGSISKEELTAGISAARSTYFTSADSDSDGQLTSAELGEKAWRKVSLADSDSSGSVSLNELQAWVPMKHSHAESSSTSERLLGRGGRRQ